MNAYQILDQVDNILTTPDRWVKGRAARNSWGETVEPNAPDACRFCLTGALDKVYPANTAARREAFDAIRSVIPRYCRGIIDFNDHSRTSFQDVKAVIARAKGMVV